MTDIRARKRKLKNELELLEGGFENRVTGIREKVLGPLEPASFIKKHPFKSLGAAVFAGFLLGLPGKKRPSGPKTSPGTSGTGFSSLLFDELKRFAARRAMLYVSDFLDERQGKKQE